jgi:cytochrome c-type biogenesis protein CcmH/NrfG
VTNDPNAPIAALKTAAHDHPDDYSARIEYARALLGTDGVTALREYDAAQRLRPQDPEPPTSIGWILAITSGQITDKTTRSQLIQRSYTEFARARRLDPKYADAYLFEGLTRYRFAGDPAGAVPLLQRYLKLAPDSGQAASVRAAVAGARKQAESATTSTTS